MLNLVKYLSSFPSVAEAVESVKSKFFIKVNSHSEYPQLLMFKYDQLESPMNEPLVRESRGIILDSQDNWKIVSYGFNKFFSHGEFYADKIDWHSAKFWEKIDGSLMFLYYYDGKWNVASSGMPDASGSASDRKSSFSDIFWDCWYKNGYDLPTDTNKTYCFELTSPLTQVIVPHANTQIRLIGIRNLDTLQEELVSESFLNWDVVQSFPINSLDDAMFMCQKMNPMQQEGFVITDANFNRVKLKSPQYVAIGHLGLTPEEIEAKGLDIKKYDADAQGKWMIKIIQTNEQSEFLTYYPQYKEIYDRLKSNFDSLCSESEALYDSVKDITDQKEYALKLKGNQFSGIFFQLKSGKLASIRDGFKATDPAKLYKVIK